MKKGLKTLIFLSLIFGFCSCNRRNNPVTPTSSAQPTIPTQVTPSITPPISIHSVILNTHNYKLSIGSSFKFMVSVQPFIENYMGITWKSSNSEIASIEANIYDSTIAIAVGNKVGTCKITATADNGIYDECNLEIVDTKPATMTGFTIVEPVKTNYFINEELDLNGMSATAFYDDGSSKTIDLSELDISPVDMSTIGEKLVVIKYNGFTESFYINVIEKPETELWDSSQDIYRNGTRLIDFYNLNDTHGAILYSSENKEPGIAKIGTYLENAKSKNQEGYVLTSSGDMWQGSAESNITKGRLMNEWLEDKGCSAFALGNHEFDWEIETIIENNKLTNFPLLACNIINRSDYQPVDWIQPYTTITRNGVHIGIIGAIGEGITNAIISSNVKDVYFDNPVPYVSKWSNFLRGNGADIVLYLYHETTESISSEITPYVDAIFGGHNHKYENNMIDGVPALEASSNGKAVSHIAINYDFSSMSYSYGQIGNDSNLMRLSDDQSTLDIISKYDDEIKSKTERVVGYTDYVISKEQIPFLYNKYAYQFFKENKDIDDEIPIFAVETNNARSLIPSGNITFGNIYKALPFDNYLCLIKVPGYRITNNLSTYASSRFYIPSSGETTSADGINAYVEDPNEYYYILIIDYIALNEYYSSWMNIVEQYQEDDALPRNIFANYVGQDYPIK